MLHERLNTCKGACCCLPGSVSSDGVVDVLPYLTRPAESPLSADTDVDQSCDVDDSPGIARAIECAASFTTPTTRITVSFPAGRYVLRSPIRPHYDNLTLTGPELSPDAVPGDPDTATLVAVPCNPEQYPGVIQVSEAVRGDGTSFDFVNDLWIRNFQIALTDGPRHQANSGIRMNQCADCLVENVIMRYAPLSTEVPSCKPANLDGITFGLGSGGMIRNVIVDGVPKGGIYLSSIAAEHGTPSVEVENCELKNINGPVGASALKIIAANVTVRNCEVHHNLVHPTSGSTSVYGGHGLFISTQNTESSTDPDLEDAVPADVTIEDSYFHHNGGSGLLMASVTEDFAPTRIHLYGVKFAYNRYYGAHIQAGIDVDLADVWSWRNGGSGIYLTSRTPALPASSVRVGDVTLENPIVFDNALNFTSGSYAGIRIEASDVTINGGEIARCNLSQGRQLKSIEQICWKSGSGSGEVLFYPEDNVISGVSWQGTSEPTVANCPYD